MTLDVDEAGPTDWERLAALFELYVYDFSALMGIDVDAHGRFRAPPLDGYFTDARWHAFLFRVDGNLAGFALVQRRSRLSGDESVTDMAEFFVLRKYRRSKIGQRAAARLFDRYPGKWEIRQKPANEAATAFWRRVISDYTAGIYEEELIAEWRVQRFAKA